MADLPTLYPAAYLAQTGTAWSSTTVGNIQADDGDFIVSGNDPTTTIDYSLDDMPVDFDAMATLSIAFDLNLVGLKNDSTVVYARIYDASNNALTDEETLASTASSESSVEFSGVVTTADYKATWDGAKVRLRIQHSISGANDGLHWEVGYVWLTGTYTAASGAPYTLECATGALTLTGVAAGITVGRNLACTTGALTLTGNDATPKVGRKLVCASGALVLTGTDTGVTVARKLSCTTAALTLTGNDANIRRGYTFACATGALTLTGTDTGLTVTRLLTCAAGALVLTGNDATLEYAPIGGSPYTLTCDAGSLTLTGNAATLTVGRILACAAGSLTLTGADASLTVGRKLTCSAAALVLTGQSVGIAVDRKLAAAVGALTLTGNAAGLAVGRKLAPAAGAYVLTGNDATLTYTATPSYLRGFGNRPVKKRNLLVARRN
ncbi:MAG TPA: hypothetical protein VMW94_10035 [Actinomycetes bacterium]|nr:hypothetical protein [Actinomycetes bacterium]